MAAAAAAAAAAGPWTAADISGLAPSGGVRVMFCMAGVDALAGLGEDAMGLAAC